MSYSVSLGPLPADGDLFTPKNAMPAFVNGCEFTDLTADTFDQTEVIFVVSQTEPPATKERGSMWFKRGEGQLYMHEIPHRDTTGAATEYTSVAIGIGPRVEILGLSTSAFPRAGMIHYPSGLNYFQDPSLVNPHRVTPYWLSSSTGTGKSSANVFRAMGINTVLPDPSNVPGGAKASAYTLRGFVHCAVNSGITCTPGQRAITSIRNDEGVGQSGWNEAYTWIKSSDHHSADSLTRHVGFIVGTAATSSEGRVYIYKTGSDQNYRW